MTQPHDPYRAPGTDDSPFEVYASAPQTDDSGRALALVMVVVVGALVAVALALVAGWRA